VGGKGRFERSAHLAEVEGSDLDESVLLLGVRVSLASALQVLHHLAVHLGRDLIHAANDLLGVVD
jgi:hypothetical protein